ncbi:hypothetical protein EXU57_18205 [Segetibacter sp. 3557_3]|uniref:outer membrane beta-barrel protein n=1 Tax=Segetibacter sp. 3557_3 TaxID=2547429 RepID=UPI0010590F11|nr:outer membrane beta-barrel protein [Segetibacter sp. 3557_3]TDH22996.1 hypothetical protein EXU57_18205 [Segetibacter sp. 3557_3]
MKTIRIIGLLVVFATAVNFAVAQAPGRVTMKLNYNAAMPVGSLKNDYITNTSFRGAFGEIGYWFNPKVSLGLGVGYQSYYQKYGRQVYKLEDNQTVSAVLSNTLEVMPVTINGTYLPLGGSEAAVQPYVSVGAGLNIVNYRQYLGKFSDGKPNTAFTANAGAGVFIPVNKSKSTSIQLGASYSMTPYTKNGLTSLNNVGVNAGVIFPLK